MSNDPNNEKRHTPGDDDVPASVTFMEMMRLAAARKAAAQRPRVPDRSAATTGDPLRSTSTAAKLATGEVSTLQETATPIFEDDPRQSAMEEQRVRRVKRRKARRRQQTVGVLGGIIRSVIVIVIAAGLMATIFTWWTPSQFISEDVKKELSVAQATSQSTAVPTVLPTPNWLRRVGIVAGHHGPQVPPDPGAVCPDGLTEASVVFSVAQMVVRNLRGRGYSVDLLDEFDPRLDNYQAAALVSIHANTCQDFGELVSGFLIASAAARRNVRGDDEILVECIGRYYQQAVNLERREGLTVDMTDYHTFREIHPLTPAAIIELGFLLADRTVLTEQQEQMAQGITDGIVCFLEPSAQIGSATETPTLELTPVPAAGG